MIALAILAAASAWLVTRKAPQHRPLAWALTVCAGLDAVRLLGLSARVDMALCLGAPAVSAWLYLVVFSRRMGGEWFVMVTGFVCGAWLAFGVPARSWAYLPAVGYLVPVSLGIGAIAAYVRERDPWTISQRVALILLAGDALAVASLCAREWISNQAGVVLAAVTVYQVTWWWRWRRCESM